jgi:hypothetical protein
MRLTISAATLSIVPEFCLFSVPAPPFQGASQEMVGFFVSAPPAECPTNAQQCPSNDQGMTKDLNPNDEGLARPVLRHYSFGLRVSLVIGGALLGHWWGILDGLV